MEYEKDLEKLKEMLQELDLEEELDSLEVEACQYCCMQSSGGGEKPFGP